jgi:hypothetical protein
VEHPAGEADDGSLRVDFDRRLRLEFRGSRITSDAGLLAYRELDDALGLTDVAGAALSECRRGRNTRHLLTGLLRQSVFGRLAGYEDVNDADRLAHDPAMRAVVDRRVRLPLGDELLGGHASQVIGVRAIGRPLLQP